MSGSGLPRAKIETRYDRGGLAEFRVGMKQMAGEEVDHTFICSRMINATPTSSPLVRLSNAYLVDPEDGSLTTAPASVWIDEKLGRIVHIAYDEEETFGSERQSLASFYAHNGLGEGHEHVLESCRTIDLDQAILSPGLIDVQINGCFGVDFSDWPSEDVLGRTAEEAYLDGLEKAARDLTCTGVTSFVPTIISQTSKSYENIVPAIDTAFKRAHNSILGYHLEGPFISIQKPGCHPQDNLTEAQDGWDAFLDMYGGHNLTPVKTAARGRSAQAGSEMVKLITVAPELQGVMGSIRRLKDAGFVVSIGHSTATTSQAMEAVNRGASMITHVFNAMPQLHHREPGILGLLGMNQATSSGPGRLSLHTSQMVRSVAASPRRCDPSDEPPFTRSRSGSSSDDALSSSPSSSMSQQRRTRTTLMNLETDQFGAQTVTRRSNSRKPYWSIIADGVHVHPMAVNLAYQSHSEGCVLITDAVQLMDPSLPDGLYPWRSPEHLIEKSGDSITLSGTDTLAGAAVSLDTCVRNMSTFCSIPLSRAIHHATRTPAKAMGPKVESTKGAVRVGWDADLCVWDRFTGQVLSTWVGGKEIYGSMTVKA